MSRRAWAGSGGATLPGARHRPARPARREEALRVRRAGAAEGLGRPLAGQEAEAAAAGDLLWRAIGELDFSGRVLAAANAALPVLPGEDVAATSASSGAAGLGRLWPGGVLPRAAPGG